MKQVTAWPGRSDKIHAMTGPLRGIIHRRRYQTDSHPRGCYSVWLRLDCGHTVHVKKWGIDGLPPNLVSDFLADVADGATIEEAMEHLDERMA